MMLTDLPGWRKACYRVWVRARNLRSHCRYGTDFSSKPGWSSYSINNNKDSNQYAPIEGYKI